MAFSATFHALGCVSFEHHTWCARLDYVGIAITIATCFLQPVSSFDFFWCRKFFLISFFKKKKKKKNKTKTTKDVLWLLL